MKRTIFTGTGLAIVAAAAIFGTTQTVNASSNAFVVTNETTKTECSACHMPYAPGFLPKRSWTAIMSDLSNHFGEDASLDAASQKEITDYLVSTASTDLRGVDPASTPLRITELPWYTRRHDERFVAYAKSHPEIGTLSNCTACHRGAERGYFEDD